MHVITDLDTGGAETMLYKLLSGIDRAEFDNQVLSLSNIGSIGRQIQTLGITVKALGINRRLPNPFKLWRLAGALRSYSPDVIQSWMYHADFAAGLANRVVTKARLAWGIRQGNLDHIESKTTTHWIAKLCAKMSSWVPDKIVCCSEVACEHHADFGYARDKMIVIPNGFDIETFRPDQKAREEVLRELGVSKKSVLIGLVARFDPLKDHRTFVTAAGILAGQSPEPHFLLCGDGVTWDNEQLCQWIEQAGMRERCHLLGLRRDIPRITAALDVATSSSYGEGFPNVVGEAMACGVPCVVTDVGDSRLIVGDTGKVVARRGAQALASAWRALIDLGAEGRARLGEAARRRIVQSYSLPAIVEQYERLYRELAEDVRDRRLH